MKCTGASWFLFLAFFCHFWLSHFSAAGNIIFNALVSFYKGTDCGRVMFSEMHYCKLVYVFGFFLPFLAQSFFSSWEHNI